METKPPKKWFTFRRKKDVQISRLLKWQRKYELTFSYRKCFPFWRIVRWCVLLSKNFRNETYFPRKCLFFSNLKNLEPNLWSLFGWMRQENPQENASFSRIKKAFLVLIMNFTRIECPKWFNVEFGRKHNHWHESHHLYFQIISFFFLMF